MSSSQTTNHTTYPTNQPAYPAQSYQSYGGADPHRTSYPSSYGATNVPQFEVHPYPYTEGACGVAQARLVLGRYSLYHLGFIQVSFVKAPQ